MSPNTKRSPATVPDRLATSSALPVTRPVAKRLAKCDVELASVTASLTRFDSSSLTAMPLSRGKFDEAVGEIGIAGCECRLDIFGDQRRIAPQGRIDAA